VRDATIATAESIDFIVQIEIIQEVPRVTDIARVQLMNSLCQVTTFVNV
jgi:hypothetical protein